MSHRIEKDSMGELNVPSKALYGAQTQRAVNNFPVSGQSMPKAFIEALLLAKSAAASANAELEQIPADMATAIIDSVNELLNDEKMMENFPVDVYQTGSGTSSNMNANEVLSTMASLKFNNKVGANDHVNYGQSSNDIIPSTIHISAAIALEKQLLPALNHLSDVIKTKAQAVDHHIKTGRTHLMDAMPVKMSQSLLSWASQIEQNITNLRSMQSALQSLAQGGTAVGTGINAHPEFSQKFSEHISKLTDIAFTPADNLFTHIGTQDIAVSVSGQLKTVAVSLLKIANDLRWMNSGPLAGLGEISLEALQPGSSIMPGKVNPVIPEATAMVAAQVIGNDSAITIAGQSGNFELNVMLPLVANNLLSNIELISNISVLLANKAIASFEVNEDALKFALARNPILVTALNPIIGYEKAAAIAKKAYAEGRAVLDVAEQETEISRQELEKLLDPTKLTQGGI